MNFQNVDALLEQLTAERVIPCISFAVGLRGEMVHSRAFGMIPGAGLPVRTDTRFDVASITKILSGMCFIQLAEEGLVSLSDPICRLFPAFDGERPIERDGAVADRFDAREITWLHALTHTSGMGWTRPITNPSLPHLAEGFEDIYALPFAARPGERVIYSDIMVILMGRAIELLTGQPLDQVVWERLCRPLGMLRTGYRRRSKFRGRANIAPTENDTWFRNRRVWGEVHDENAWLMDGVAGHAGIFSTAEDLCTFALHYAGLVKRYEEGGGSASTFTLLSPATAESLIHCQAEDDGERRGILWQLSGRGPEAYTRHLSERAYGHAGFTGCFLWNDPETDLSVVLLSNDVFNGRAKRKLFDHRGEIMRRTVETVRG